MCPRHVVMIIPLEPGPAFEVCQFSFRYRYTQGTQDGLHAGTGHLAHTQKDEFVAVGYQHICLLRLETCSGNFDVIMLVPQRLFSLIMSIGPDPRES